MTARSYSSADPGAPVLRGGNPGDLINLLDKCLVTGYGSKTAAGWTKPFTSGNIAAFQTGAGSNGMLLRVDDTSTNTSSRAARIVGYEAMTDVNTGTGRFPTETQEPGGMKLFTHYAGATADAHSWMVFADEAFVIICIQTYPGQENQPFYRECSWFGDIVPLSASDTYATVIQGKPNSSSPNTSESHPLMSSSVGSSSSAIYLARSYTGLGGSAACSRTHDYAKSGSTEWGYSSYLPYPHGPDGALFLSQIWIAETGTGMNSAIRGHLPGIWAPLQTAGLNSGDTFDGQGDLAGKKFMTWRHYNCRVCFETTNGWR